MLMSMSAADAVPNIIDVLGERYELTPLIGQAPTRGIYIEGNEANDNALPQGFLVRQPAGATTHPHFHEHNQFQVFVDGHGRFGKKPALPVTIQYASGHTPYGPIVAGPQGVTYFTLRQRWDPGAKYMPKMRDKLIRGRQRQHLVADINIASQIEAGAQPDVQIDTLIAAEADGLYAALIQLPPDGAWHTPDPIDGGGQYHVVVRGGLHGDAQHLPKWSCQFATPDTGPVTLCAGSEGAAVLLLRFPKVDANGAAA